MVLAGLVIAVGVVVDDAIIDVENIVRRLRHHRASGGTESTARVVVNASLEVRGPIVYATLIIVAATVPIFFLDGLTGAFFRPLATSYTLAVMASMVVALTVTPAMAYIFLRNAKLEDKDPPVVRVLKRWYGRLLRPMVRRPAPGYLALGALGVIGLVLAPLLGQSLLPSFKERDFLMHWLTQPGTSNSEEVRVSQLACKELMTITGVNNCGSHIGQAFNADEVVGVYFGENWISVDPAVDYDETLAAVQEVVSGYPGIMRDVQTYLKERIREVLTGTGYAVVVRVYGDDLATLKQEADKIKSILGGIEGASRCQGRPPSQHSADQRGSESGCRKALRAEARRRATCRGHPGRRRGSRRRLPGWQGLRRPGVERAGDPDQRHQHREPPARHPFRGKDPDG